MAENQEKSPTVENNNENDNEVSLTIPSHMKDRNVFLKIDNTNIEKKNMESSKFRSFCINVCHYDSASCHLAVGNKIIPFHKFVNMLQTHGGLSKNIPITIISNNIPIVEFKIDFYPHNCVAPAVYPFMWHGVECSLTGTKTMAHIYIRVHNMETDKAEAIVNDIFVTLYNSHIIPIPEGVLNIYTPFMNPAGYYNWQPHSTKTFRDISTIYIDPAVKNKMVAGLDKFLVSAPFYDKFSVTWKRVHLFYGSPGSGKSSTVLALASRHKKHIAKFTITPHMNSQHIEQLFNAVPQNTWILLEDVDALFTQRTGNGSIDFSTLLNCMDGLTTKRGQVLFMTTNHLEKLDEAFIRPGRIDLLLEFTLPGINELRETLRVLAPEFGKEHEQFLAERGTGMSIAALQKHLFECYMEERTTIL